MKISPVRAAQTPVMPGFCATLSGLSPTAVPTRGSACGATPGCVTEPFQGSPQRKSEDVGLFVRPSTLIGLRENRVSLDFALPCKRYPFRASLPEASARRICTGLRSEPPSGLPHGLAYRAFWWTVRTARPEGSAMLAQAASQRMAVGVLQAMLGPSGTSSGAPACGKWASKMLRYR